MQQARSLLGTWREYTVLSGRTQIACVASVPIRAELKHRAARRNFRVREARKMEREQKGRGRGVGRGKKGTLARKTLYSEKPVRPRTGLLIGAAWFV